MVGTRGLGMEPAKQNFEGRRMGMGTGIACAFESRRWNSGLNEAAALGWGRGVERKSREEQGAVRGAGWGRENWAGRVGGALPPLLRT